jgi:hypothetical protein
VAVLQGRCVLIHWFKEVDAEGLAVAEQVLREAAVAGGPRLHLAILIPEVAGVPSANIQQAIARLAPLALATCDRCHLVLLAQGVLATLQRVTFKSIALLAKVGRDFLVFHDTLEAMIEAVARQTSVPAPVLLAEARQMGLMAGPVAAVANAFR